MAEPNCAACWSAHRGEAVRGRVTYRCFDPTGRLMDPATGEAGGSTFGRAVSPPMVDGAAERLGIEAPEWCPRRSGYISPSLAGGDSREAAGVGA